MPERQVLLWTQPRRPELFRFGSFPIFYMESPEGNEMNRYYGLPIHGTPGFKIGKYHHRHQIVDPDRMDRDCHPEDEAVLSDLPLLPGRGRSDDGDEDLSFYQQSGQRFCT